MKKSLGPKAIVYPTPVFVIGSYDNFGKPNLMTASWGGICCSHPPSITVSLRKNRLTYSSILERKAFTVNIPSEIHVNESDFFGITSGKETDKFAAAKLTPIKAQHVDAPFVKEFPLVLECRLTQTVEIGVHTQFIGEIIDTKAETSVLNEKGIPDIKKVRPFLFAPEGRGYYSIGRFIGRAFSIGKRFM